VNFVEIFLTLSTQDYELVSYVERYPLSKKYTPIPVRIEVTHDMSKSIAMLADDILHYFSIQTPNYFTRRNDLSTCLFGATKNQRYLSTH